MGKATGVFLILAGVGTAALVLPAVDKDAERQLAEVVRIATGATPAANGQQSPTDSSRNMPAPVQLRPTAAAPTPSSATDSKPAVRTAAARPPETIPPTGPQILQAGSAAPSEPVAQPAPVLVRPPQVLTKNATASPARPVDMQARQNLARDIQKELKRVGCYDGELTGDWTPNTRRAMKMFIDRVNAALPIDEPDNILRTMVQGHPGNACGRNCPSGQAMNNEGRCLPAAIVAQQSAPKPTRPQEVPYQAAAVAKDAGQHAPSHPRAMAPPSQAAAQARPAAPKPAWETTIATAPAAPLPGESRMAIGAPVDAPARTASVPTTSGVSVSVTGSRPAAAGTAMPVDRVPGAIAAFATPTTSAALATAPQAPPHLISPDAGATLPPDAAPSGIPVPGGVAAIGARPRQAAVRRPPPEPFKFPAPSYIGSPIKNHAPVYSAPERSKFGPRIFRQMMENTR